MFFVNTSTQCRYIKEVVLNCKKRAGMCTIFIIRKTREELYNTLATTGLEYLQPATSADVLDTFLKIQVRLDNVRVGIELFTDRTVKCQPTDGRHVAARIV